MLAPNRSFHRPAGLLGFVLFLTVSICQAVEVPGLDYYLPVASANYDPAAPTPEQVLGFQVGEWHLHHHELVDYLTKLAAWSPRLTVREYARSHGRRPLLAVTVTQPENHERLEEIRKSHVARVKNSGKADADLEQAPIVVWMGYGVHGNEPSASNASVLLAYHLAAARDKQTLDFLAKAVVLIEPCLNPDGMERFADWTNSHRGQYPSAHRSDREHKEGYPSGRSNYYWFDLNRDWLPAVHPESKGRLKLFHEWQPNIVTDYHEMGNVNRTYFFQPGIAKMVHPLTPPENQTLTAKMAREHARALDAIGSLYYTGESYDDFYYGKGSTYPDVNGSVGVLFEQASSRGFHTDTEHGRLSFPFTIRNQITTSLSTLKAAHQLRGEFLTYQQSFYQDALKEAVESKIQAHLFSAPGDAARLRHFQELLALHDIETLRPADDMKVGDRTFAAADSLIVATNQRQFRLLTAMFETRTKFQSNIFYDVSAWHLPSAYGLLHAELEAVPEGAKAGDIAVTGSVKGPEKAYAYVFPWEPRFAPRALFKLVEAEARCWFASRSFTVGSGGRKTTYQHGSIVIPVAVQDKLEAAELRALMDAIAKEDGLEVQAVTSGYHNSIPNLGSPTFQPVQTGGVMLVVGSGVNSAAAGEVWHQFDQVWKTPLTMVESESVTTSTLSGFSTVILAGTTFTSLPSGARTALEAWTRRGGCLIATGSSASSLAAQEWCKVETVKAATSSSAAKGKPTQHSLPYDQAAERRTEREVNGVVVEAVFDPTHPLTYGYSRQMPHLRLLRTSTTYLKPSSTSYLNPVQYTDSPLISGFASTANRNAMKNSTPVQVKTVDSGRVILIIDNPVFRGHWLGTEKLLANAIFFGPSVRSTGGDADEDDEDEGGL